MAALVMVTESRLRRFSLLLLALLHQQLITEHLADDLLGLGFGFLLELAHGWPPRKRQRRRSTDISSIRPQPLTGLPPAARLRPVPHNVTILSQSKTKRKATADRRNCFL